MVHRQHAIIAVDGLAMRHMNASLVEGMHYVCINSQYYYRRGESATIAARIDDRCATVTVINTGERYVRQAVIQSHL
jgi:hypothetical protein